MNYKNKKLNNIKYNISHTKSNISSIKSNISPTKSNNSPTKSNISPTKYNISPTKSNISLTKSNISPTNSAKKYSSPIFEISYNNNINYINFYKCIKQHCHIFFEKYMKKYKTFLIDLLKNIETYYYNINNNNKINNKKFINDLFKIFFNFINDLLNYKFFNCILKNCKKEYIKILFNNIENNNLNMINIENLKKIITVNKNFINKIFGINIINELIQFIELHYYSLINENITEKEFDKLKEIYLFFINTLYKNNNKFIIQFFNNNINSKDTNKILFGTIFMLKILIENFDHIDNFQLKKLYLKF